MISATIRMIRYIQEMVSATIRNIHYTRDGGVRPLGTFALQEMIRSNGRLVPVLAFQSSTSATMFRKSARTQPETTPNSEAVLQSVIKFTPGFPNPGV
ncbi:hypothetical protein RRG08_033191 [Elysia crispata]|uniref:Uncharacterized protein n=1 Tax=Elysia crispata TaxID=231223 RepID=A0AAE1ED45_9GAST|nr:hypothetical protein RRG08_033191 [Elysia crispata]